ncbi:MAG: sigma-70 family RNA polymerase sigma factor [Candidatus Doudnabacteria bacterium]|nr:sigma-70 family RNA polymerase sigma factor [Candidatus Doudnabacteria bacterium]
MDESKFQKAAAVGAGSEWPIFKPNPQPEDKISPELSEKIPDQALQKETNPTALDWETIYPVLLKICQKMVPRERPNRQEEAKDLAHDIAINILKSSSPFDGSAKLESWLAAIARNAVINKYHRMLNTAKYVDRDSLKTEPLDTEQGLNYPDTAFLNPEQQAIKTQQFRLIKQALSQLPEIDRQVWELGRMQGYEIPEIVKITGLSKSLVKDKLFRTTHFLRKELSRFYSSQSFPKDILDDKTFEAEDKQTFFARRLGMPATATDEEIQRKIVQLRLTNPNSVDGIFEDFENLKRDKKNLGPADHNFSN